MAKLEKKRETKQNKTKIKPIKTPASLETETNVGKLSGKVCFNNVLHATLVTIQIMVTELRVADSEAIH